MNARKVPAEAMIQKMFCQRSVILVPAISSAVISTIMNRPPRKIHVWSAWNLSPHVIKLLLWKTMPDRTSVGPSANTGKYRAQNVAPIMAENAAPKLDTVASGGDRIRLTQTESPPGRGIDDAMSAIMMTTGMVITREDSGALPKAAPRKGEGRKK